MIRYDGDNVLYELSLPGSEFNSATTMEQDHPSIVTDTMVNFDKHGVAYYTHAGGIDRPLSVTRIDWDGPAFRSPDSATVYLHTGWHGRFDMGSTLAGKKAWKQFDWDSKGMTTRFSGARSAGTGSPKPWFGSVVDGYQDKSGLIYMRNRFYDPGTGRFTQEDPMGLAGGLNLYGYANGDPVNFSDPFGLWADSINKATPSGPPPVPVPGGGAGNGWQWNPDPNNKRGGTWGPKDPIPGQSQPSGSWEEGEDGHWDIDDGKGVRRRYDENAKPLSPEEAHGQRPRENTDVVEKISEITGLTGTALMIYIVISEGSRIIFPIRNLVPVP